MQAKISVIIPIYNAEKYLTECLNSIINQTLKDIEIICVDDGSTDNSLNILNDYAKKDTRIKILKQKNQYAGVARNNGAKAATGEYLHFMDADDYLYDDKVYENIYDELSQLNFPNIIRAKAIAFDDDTGEYVENHVYERTRITPESNELSIYKDLSLITKLAVAPWVGIIKRDFVIDNNLEFNDNKCCNDRSFYVLSYLTAKLVYLSDVCIIKHRVNNNVSLRGIRDKNFDCHFKSIDIVYNFLKEHDFPKDISTHVMICELRDMSLFFKRFFYNSPNSYEIYKSVIEYLSHYDLSQYEPEIDNYKTGRRLKNLKNKKGKFLPIDYLYERYINKLSEDSVIEQIKSKFNNSDKPIYKKIFSIENDDTRKVINIFGLKFKIKLQKLVNRVHDWDLESIHSELYHLRKEYQYKLHRYCPEDKRPMALSDWYFEKTGDFLNLDNPQTINEKIQWMKLYDSTPIKTQLADKYLVRDWVQEKIGEEYLIPLLGVWDNFDEIDFDELPDKFVLKCNHGCKYNIIVKNQDIINIDDIKAKINGWMNEDFAFKDGFQMHYSPIVRKIIAEKYIENEDNDLYDYKFWCFNGKVEYIQFLSDRYKEGLKGAFYDRNWIRQNFVSNPYEMTNIERPDNLDEMIELAEKLSCGFNFVRVDFYRLNNGKIYFGEMTFTPGTGIMQWNPREYNLLLGKKLQLENKKDLCEIK